MLRNITLSAEVEVIEKARKKASLEKRSLNELFRKWLKKYSASDKKTAKHYQIMMKKLRHVQAGKKNSRDEMNER